MKVALELEPCCGQRSGIGFYTSELAKRMISDDVLQFSGNIYDFRGKGNYKANLSDIPVKLHSCQLMPYWLYHRIWHKIKLPYEMLFPAADITHFFNYIVPPKIKGKVLTTVHDLTYLRYPETMNERGLQFLNAELERSLDRCDRIITVSEFTKSEVISQLGIDPGRIRVISPDAQVSTTTLPLDYLKNKWGIEEGYIFFVGNMEPRKNLLRLLQAYKKLRDEAGILQPLVIAGGSGWKSEEIKKAAEETPGCILTGYVSNDEKALLYKHAGVVAYVSLYEGFGMPVLEAMKSGVPIVCSNAASLPEVAGDAARFVQPEDVVSIAQGLFDVLSNPALREEMREKGLRNATRYSWDISAQRARDIYMEFA